MKGRFFRNFSESETESSETESVTPAPVKTLATAYTFSDDEEEDTKRVVRSTKEKRYEELQTLIKQARNHKKNKDIAKLLDGFEELCRLYQKAKNFLDKDSDLSTPRIYLRYLSELDQFINDLWNDKEVKKNLSKNNNKSLTILRQKLRKYNKDFESEIALYRANQDPSKDDSDEESDVSDKADEDEQASDEEPASKPAASKFIKKGSDDESDSEWESDEEESSMSSDEDDVKDLREKFLKQKDAKEVKDPLKKKDKKERPAKEKERKKEKKEEEERETEEKRPGKHRLFQKEELNHTEVLNKVYEILAMRGKRKIQRSEQLKLLNEILAITHKQNLGPAMEIKILLGIITSLFDYNPNTQLCIKQSLWLRCLKYIILLLEKLSDNPDITIGEDIPEDKESYAEAPYMINGCVVTIIERMDTEFTRILQAADAHSPEYVEKLKFENIVNKIIIRLQQYLEDKKATTSDMCRAYMLRIVHLYYKYDSSLFKSDADASAKQTIEKTDATAIDTTAAEEQPESKPEETTPAVENEEQTATPAEAAIVIENGEQQPAQPAVQLPVKKPAVDKLKELQIEVKESNENSLQLMDRLCKYIYTNDSTDRIRTQAILYHIYHHALHDNWFEARDLTLMSQLQHNIVKADIPLHIIYNRALVQLGLCAFRHGYIREAHQDLLDIHIQSRAKELLAQGILPKNQERTLEQEKEEKQRLLPFHMHINLELLECAYLVSAMLLEIPDVAANEYNVRKKNHYPTIL